MTARDRGGARAEEAAGRPLTDADHRALAAFRRALRVFLRFSEQAAQAEGLTPAQHQLLLAVRGRPEGTAATIGYLADALQLRSSSVVGLVDRAEAAGLVTSAADPDDRRRRVVSLTAEAEARIDRLSRRHRTELASFRRELTGVLDAIERTEQP